MKSLSLSPAVLLVIILPLLVAVEARKVVGDAVVASVFGGFQPIGTITLPHIQDLGRFAVSEHNREAKTQLQFVQVYGGEFQVVEGTKYKLLIKAGNGGPIGNYGATVYEDLQEKLQLQDFFPVPKI